MKKLLFVIYLFVIIVSNATSPKSSNQKKTILSLIDDCKISGDSVYIDLLELPHCLSFHKSDSDINPNIIIHAMQNGMPLKFSYASRQLINLSKPNIHDCTSYLSAFVSLCSFNESDMPINRINLSELNIMFKEFIRSNNLGILETESFNEGCETRAALVSEFIEKTYGIKPFKLFLKGSIISNFNQRSYKWRNHCVCVLKNCTDSCKLMIIDPFLCCRPISVSEFLSDFISNGSIISNLKYTKSDIFTVNFQSRLGVKDHNYVLSKSLLNKYLTYD